MSQYLPTHTETIKKFIYDNKIIDIEVNFEDSDEKIPIKIFVTKNTDESNFTWYILNIKLDLPKSEYAKVTLNHPTSPMGITTLDNMKFVAITVLENMIPALIKKNYSIIKEYLSQHNPQDNS